MAEVILFHHAQGLTPGVIAFADELHEAGHIVHTPDMFDGHTFENLEKGMGFVGELGFGKVLERGESAVDGLPAELVYAGFSLGVVPAQKLAQTCPGRAGRFYSTPASLYQSMGRHGPRVCQYRCTQRMPTHSLLMMAISTPQRSLSKKPRKQSCSSTPVTSIYLPTTRFLPTIQTHLQSL